jgi:hypothetical protein
MALAEFEMDRCLCRFCGLTTEDGGNASAVKQTDRAVGSNNWRVTLYCLAMFAKPGQKGHQSAGNVSMINPKTSERRQRVVIR